MSEKNMDTIPEKNEIRKNSDQVRLFLDYGKKWGIFTLITGTKRVYRYKGALHGLAFLIHAITQEEGLEAAKNALQSIDQQMTQPDGKLNLFLLKGKIVEKQHQQLEKDRIVAKKSGDKKLLSAVKFDEGMLKVSEKDMDGKHPISLGSFDVMAEELLPDWAQDIMTRDLLPSEIEAMLGNKEKVAQGSDPEIEIRSGAAHAKVDKTLNSPS